MGQILYSPFTHAEQQLEQTIEKALPKAIGV